MHGDLLRGRHLESAARLFVVSFFFWGGVVVRDSGDSGDSGVPVLGSDAGALVLVAFASDLTSATFSCSKR